MRSISLEPTIEDAFAIGKLEGHKESLQELKEMIEGGASLEILLVYIKAKSNTLNLQIVNNPFKQKDSKDETSGR